jgi:hypothetical protein
MTSSYAWHKTLTFIQQSSYELSKIKSFFIIDRLLIRNLDDQNPIIISDMKFFMWYKSYAIYGAREKLILLKPNQNNSNVI